MSLLTFKRNSMRTKLLGLVAFVAFAVAGVSAAFSYWRNRTILRAEMVRRGHYIAGNLAYNSKYGVLTEDRPLLTGLLEGAMSAGGTEGSDVAGAAIRDSKGEILAAKGVVVKTTPSLDKDVSEKDAVTEAGEPVLVFEAPVTASTGAGGGSMAAELGVGGGPAKPVEEQRGS